MRQIATHAGHPTATGDLPDRLASFRKQLRAENASPNTIYAYCGAVEKFADYLVAQGMPLDVDNITREHVESFVTQLLETRKPATAHQRFRGCQRFFNWLVEEGELKTSPMARMRPPRLPLTPPGVPTDEQLSALLSTIRADRATDWRRFTSRRDEALVRILAGTGLRRAEIANLRLVPDDHGRLDVDTERDMLRVIGKGRKERTVVLLPKAAAALDRYLSARKRHPSAPEPWLWIGHKGRLTGSGIFQILRERARQAGLGEDFNVHRLRHYWAHTALTKGMQETDVMRGAGWSSRAMLSRYAASTGEARAQAAARRIGVGEDL